MKKNLRLLAVFVLLTAFAQGAWAGIGVFAGGWDTKDYDTLYGGGVRLGIDLLDGLGVYASAAYYTSDNDDIDIDVIPLEAGVMWIWDVNPVLKPFVGAGVGYYFKNDDVNSDVFDSNTQDCVGYFAHGGLMAQLGPVNAFAELKYTLVQDDDEFVWRGTDVKETYSLDGFGVNVGLRIGF